MRVCMLAPEFIPVWGGVGTYTIGLLRHLPKTYEVHVIAPKHESLAATKHRMLRCLDILKVTKIHYISSAKDTFICNFETSAKDQA
jgi:hypothetical protein